MGVISVIFSIIAIIIAMVIGAGVLWFALMVLPIILGIWGCISLWGAGHDNIAILVLIGSGIFNLFWFYWISEGIGNPSSRNLDRDPFFSGAGKKRIYDKDGKHIGYEDR